MKNRSGERACFKNQSSERVRFKKRSTAFFQNCSWSVFQINAFALGRFLKFSFVPDRFFIGGIDFLNADTLYLWYEQYCSYSADSLRLCLQRQIGFDLLSSTPWSTLKFILQGGSAILPWSYNNQDLIFAGHFLRSRKTDQFAKQWTDGGAQRDNAGGLI